MPDQPDSAELPKKFVMDFGPPGVPQDYVAPLMLAPLILDLGGQVTNTPVSPPNLEEARTHTYILPLRIMYAIRSCARALVVGGAAAGRFAPVPRGE